MWDDIDFGQETTQDLKWVAEGMQNNTLVWTMGGSYDRKWVADLSGVSWIIFCKRTGLWMTGMFWEKSPSASLFRAEMLGLCCLHLLARAVAESFGTGQWEAVTLCNNKKALELSSNHWQRIQLRAKCADIRQLLGHQTGLHRGVQICPYIRTHGSVSFLEPTQSHAATKLHL